MSAHDDEVSEALERADLADFEGDDELVITSTPPFWWQVLNARIDQVHADGGPTNCGHFDRPMVGFIRLDDPSVIRCAACEVEAPRSGLCECCHQPGELTTVRRREALCAMSALVCSTCEVTA